MKTPYAIICYLLLNIIKQFPRVIIFLDCFLYFKGNYENTEAEASAPGVSVISDQVYYNADM